MSATFAQSKNPLNFYPNSIPKIRNFHVVGGGCFGSQYVRWLQIARERNKVEFQKIKIIDHHSNCKISTVLNQDSSLEFISQDWVSYLTAYLLEFYSQGQDTQDHWVPSPFSPHLIFLSFLRAAQNLNPHLQFKIKNFDKALEFPVKISLQDGNVALSFAEWICPTNCTEPPRCPRLQAPKTWDVRKALQHQLQYETASVHILQCLHLTHAVGTIACDDILREFRIFLERIQKNQLQEVIVATVSTCHGIVGMASLEPQSPSDNGDEENPRGHDD